MTISPRPPESKPLDNLTELKPLEKLVSRAKIEVQQSEIKKPEGFFQKLWTFFSSGIASQPSLKARLSKDPELPQRLQTLHHLLLEGTESLHKVGIQIVKLNANDTNVNVMSVRKQFDELENAWNSSSEDLNFIVTNLPKEYSTNIEKLQTIINEAFDQLGASLAKYESKELQKSFKDYIGPEVSIPLSVVKVIEKDKACRQVIKEYLDIANEVRKENRERIANFQIPEESDDLLMKGGELGRLSTEEHPPLPPLLTNEEKNELNKFFSEYMIARTGYANVQMVSDGLDPSKAGRALATEELYSSYKAAYPQHAEEMEKYRKQEFLTYCENPLMLRHQQLVTEFAGDEGGFINGFVQVQIHHVDHQTYQFKVPIDLTQLWVLKSDMSNEQVALVRQYIGHIAADNEGNAKTILKKMNETDHPEETPPFSKEFVDQLNQIASDVRAKSLIECGKVFLSLGEKDQRV